jgi:hypothetical protein
MIMMRCFLNKYILDKENTKKKRCTLMREKERGILTRKLLFLSLFHIVYF